MGFWTAARAAAALLLLAGCAGRAPYAARSAPPTLPPRPHGAPPSALPLPRIEFSIQVGAFASPDNAIRLRESLEEHGVEAFHFVGDDGLCRVRFGSFSERALAVEAAEALRRGGVIQGYYVVPPGPSGLARGDTWLRGQIVRSAMSFLGWPYRWGGPSPESGFDCSGLTMTAYRLNGIALPRTSGEQFVAGASVSIAALRQGDLVFFAIESQNKPTHVGLYLGDGRFIHAPGAGKVVRIDDLSQDYFARRFLAARSYVDAE